MNSMGMNASSMITGDCRPTTAATSPRTAARLYPGAVEATPMTVLDSSPSVPARNPLSLVRGPVDASTTTAPLVKEAQRRSLPTRNQSVALLTAFGGETPDQYRPGRRSSTRATPSSALEAVTSSTAASTSGWAFAVATEWPVQASIGRSFGMSPNPTTASGPTPSSPQSRSSANALVTPAAEIST